MITIEIEKVEPRIFYPSLRFIVEERIAEIKKEIEHLEFIERSRGLFGYEKTKLAVEGRALTTNENFMVYFDKDYMIMQ
ncbi:MAG: hypothetical protein CL529_12620 [Aequorivita sp.]|nr:hypothetical protein [Aequorivita sp.]|tara:strand:- start:27464 stop:27700 length:237 start_codon:yes stop_codon:yes gene_type:complete